MYSSVCVTKTLPVHILVLETVSICNTDSRIYAPPKNIAWISQTSYWFHYQIWQGHNNIQVLRKLKLTQNFFHPKICLIFKVHGYVRILYGALCFVSFFVISNQKSDTGLSFSWTIFWWQFYLGYTTLLPRVFKAQVHLLTSTSLMVQ